MQALEHIWHQNAEYEYRRVYLRFSETCEVNGADTGGHGQLSAPNI